MVAAPPPPHCGKGASSNGGGTHRELSRSIPLPELKLKLQIHHTRLGRGGSVRSRDGGETDTLASDADVSAEATVGARVAGTAAIRAESRLGNRLACHT